MDDFKREERYIVVKLKDIPREEASLRAYLGALSIPTRECVVVEPHHPHYEETWENVQRWAEGRPSIREERDALCETARLAEKFARAKGRYNSQSAMCDLLEHFGRPCTRPGGE